MQECTTSYKSMRYIIYQNYLYSFYSIDHSAKYNNLICRCCVLIGTLNIPTLLLLSNIILSIFLNVNNFCKLFLKFVILEYMVLLFTFISYKAFKSIIKKQFATVACACLDTRAPLRGADKHTPKP